MVEARDYNEAHAQEGDAQTMQALQEQLLYQ